MLDKEAKNIDAVTVGTPDHIHAVAAMAAIRAGKHVYCQKPLTHTLHECRELTKAARPAGVDTSDGQPGARQRRRAAHQRVDSGRRHRRGARGPRLVRPRRPAVEARHRPADRHAAGARRRSTGTCGSARSASGPTTRPTRPSSWRGWWDFGTGALGDMGCHIIDHPVWALNLGAPTVGRGAHHARRHRARRQQAQLRDVSRSPRSSTTSSPRAASCRRCG